ncbi:Far-red impaired responsive family protein [Prunus dulcis]|uniref:Far-red impaired responsive family protein n=1 Tax=Prunus dulcis TaxID=3755 RepID=A0A4Y1QP89_PRUDU|nr:Far-red impaired responsive family protein [Prunus dulcis]
MAIGGAHGGGDEQINIVARIVEVQMDDHNGTVYTSEGAETTIVEVSTNQEPYDGKLFESEDAARVFYDDYASRVGFLTRVLSSRKSERDGSIISRGLGCRGVSDNGRKVMQECAQREFCTAMVLLRQEKPGSWVVKKFLKDHNHPLVVQSQKSRRTLKPKDEEGRKLVDTLQVLEGLRFHSSGEDDRLWLLDTNCCNVVGRVIQVSSDDILTTSEASKLCFTHELSLVQALCLVKDEKNKKIQELTAQLRVKKQLSAAYREQLLAFMTDVEDHNNHLSIKLQSVFDNLKVLEAKTVASVLLTDKDKVKENI